MDEIEYSDIARLLSDLSRRPQLPAGVSAMAPSEFEPEDVGFSDNSWLARVADVQGWLRLEDSIGAQSSEAEVAKVLFDQLDPDAESPLFSVSDGVVTMTDLGGQLLETRLARADERSLRFVEAIDEGTTLAAASSEWEQAWDEPEPTEPPKIKALADVWPIIQFTDLAVENELDLNPSYQREYIWSNADSQKLIESVLRGIPLPSVILASMPGDARLQIVDGKQRLTSILRFVGAHPSALAFAKEKGKLDLFRTNFRKWVTHHRLTTKDIRKHYLPFKTATYPKSDPLSKLSGRYYDEIKEEETSITGKQTSVRKLFASSAVDYRIPILKYEDTAVRDIHRVFTLYNKQGVKLNAEEIRNAVYNHLKIVQLMLFIGGDRDEASMAEYAVTAGVDPAFAHKVIDDMGFSIARFRRTKILLWTLAMLLHSTRSRDGQLRAPSTASHIDSFLDSIEAQRLSRLRNIPVLVDLARSLVDAITLHANADEAWHPKFRSKKQGSKWEDLGAVASIGACLIIVLLGRKDLLLERRAVVREVTSGKKGPDSTQNKTQWQHIADSLLSILDSLDISSDQAKAILEERFGTSAIDGLTELRALKVDG